MKSITSAVRSHPARLALVIVLLAVAVFGVYRFANGQDARAQDASQGTLAVASTATTGTTAAVSAAGTGASCCATGTASGSGSCCATGGAGGGAGASTSTQGAAQVTGNVQKISVDLSSGAYDPSTIELRAGVPAEITFGRSSGCTAIVQSADLGFQADLSGGPQTVKLPGLQPGTYGFACGMNMVKGQIVVR